MNPIENLKDLIIYQSKNNDNVSVEVLVNTKINVKIIQCRSQYDKLSLKRSI